MEIASLRNDRRTMRPAAQYSPNGRPSDGGSIRATVAGQACALCATPFSSSSVSSSPDWNISVTISQPPTNSPFT